LEIKNSDGKNHIKSGNIILYSLTLTVGQTCLLCRPGGTPKPKVKVVLDWKRSLKKKGAKQTKPKSRYIIIFLDQGTRY
jgi:hypothetical protein